MSTVMKDIFFEVATKNGWFKEREDEIARAEGIAIAQNIALKLLKRGIPIETIIEDTGLDEDMVMQLKNELENR